MRRGVPKLVARIIVGEFLLFTAALLLLWRFGKLLQHFSYLLSLFITLFSVTLALWNRFEKLMPKSVWVIGQFPQHTKKLAKIVQSATRNLLIMVDCADYGSFWSPDDHRRLHEAIKAARKRGLPVRMLLIGQLAPITRNSPYYSYEDAFERLRRTREYSRFFRSFWPGLPEPTNPEEFEKAMVDHQIHFMEELVAAGVIIHWLPNPPLERSPVFLWITGQVAVVSHASNKEGEAASAFATQEEEVIRVLTSIFEYYWGLAESHDDASR